MIVHGLADDNVLVAHSLQLSQRLTEAGRPHTFLPLTATTHMASDPEVAEHLLVMQLRFLAGALGAGGA
jgi:dipeptidyl-peptidase-4